MKTPSIIAAFVGTLLLANTPALAEVLLMTQLRSLESSAYAEDINGSDSMSDLSSAPDFGPYVDGVVAEVSLESALAVGSAHQTSTLSASTFEIAGGSAANAEAYDFDGFGYGDASGTTSFQCTFEVTTPTTVVLTGYLEAFDDGEAYVILDGPSEVFYFDAYNTIVDLNESAALEPGLYGLVVEGRSSAYGDAFTYGYGFGGFDLELNFSSPAAVPGTESDAMALSLSPNPFSNRTQIAYAAPSAQPTSLEIFDVRGRRVRQLLSSGAESGGLQWDGKDGAGRDVAPAVYFVVLRSGTEIRQEKVTLLR